MTCKETAPHTAIPIFNPDRLTPPQSDDERIRWLQLKRSARVGTRTFFRLLEKYGSAGEALLALPEITQKAGIKGYTPADPLECEREYRAGCKMGAELVTFGSPAYPPALFALNDPPPLFWAKGALSILQKPLISLVGTRNASSLGMRMSEKIAHDLGARGFAIVSGLARGIDTAAHHGALESGTIGVLASGVDRIYPPQNTGLAQKICKNGLLMSEMALGHAPIGAHFPMRNRLIAALGCCTVIIEAAIKSGSIITANMALDMGRDVCAIPGHPLDERSAGANKIIRDGARLIRSAADIEAEIKPIALGRRQNPRPCPQSTARAKGHRAQNSQNSAAFGENPLPLFAPRRKEVRALGDKIMHQLGANPVCEDQLLRALAPPDETAVAQSLLDLELKGRITRHAGGFITRKGA